MNKLTMAIALIASVATIILIVDEKIKERKENKILDTKLKIYVYDNGNPAVEKDITVGSLIATMKHWDCSPFDRDDILKAKRIETRAYGWSSTSFTLIFEDGSEKTESAWHR